MPGADNKADSHVEAPMEVVKEAEKPAVTDDKTASSVGASMDVDTEEKGKEQQAEDAELEQSGGETATSVQPSMDVDTEEKEKEPHVEDMDVDADDVQAPLLPDTSGYEMLLQCSVSKMFLAPVACPEAEPEWRKRFLDAHLKWWDARQWLLQKNKVGLLSKRAFVAAFNAFDTTKWDDSLKIQGASTVWRTVDVASSLLSDGSLPSDIVDALISNFAKSDAILKGEARIAVVNIRIPTLLAAVDSVVSAELPGDLEGLDVMLGEGMAVVSLFEAQAERYLAFQIRPIVAEKKLILSWSHPKHSQLKDQLERLRAGLAQYVAFKMKDWAVETAKHPICSGLRKQGAGCAIAGLNALRVAAGIADCPPVWCEENQYDMRVYEFLQALGSLTASTAMWLTDEVTGDSDKESDKATGVKRRKSKGRTEGGLVKDSPDLSLEFGEVIDHRRFLNKSVLRLVTHELPTQKPPGESVQASFSPNDAHISLEETASLKAIPPEDVVNFLRLEGEERVSQGARSVILAANYGLGPMCKDDSGQRVPTHRVRYPLKAIPLWVETSKAITWQTKWRKGLMWLKTCQDVPVDLKNRVFEALATVQWRRLVESSSSNDLNKLLSFDMISTACVDAMLGVAVKKNMAAALLKDEPVGLGAHVIAYTPVAYSLRNKHSTKAMQSFKYRLDLVFAQGSVLIGVAHSGTAHFGVYRITPLKRVLQLEWADSAPTGSCPVWLEDGLRQYALLHMKGWKVVQVKNKMVHATQDQDDSTSCGVIAVNTVKRVLNPNHTLWTKETRNECRVRELVDVLGCVEKEHRVRMDEVIESLGGEIAEFSETLRQEEIQRFISDAWATIDRCVYDSDDGVVLKERTKKVTVNPGVAATKKRKASSSGSELSSLSAAESENVEVEAQQHEPHAAPVDVGSGSGEDESEEEEDEEAEQTQPEGPRRSTRTAATLQAGTPPFGLQSRQTAEKAAAAKAPPAKRPPRKKQKTAANAAAKAAEELFDDDELEENPRKKERLVVEGRPAVQGKAVYKLETVLWDREGKSEEFTMEFTDQDDYLNFSGLYELAQSFYVDGKPRFLSKPEESLFYMMDYEKYKELSEKPAELQKIFRKGNIVVKDFPTERIPLEVDALRGIVDVYAQRTIYDFKKPKPCRDTWGSVADVCIISKKPNPDGINSLDNPTPYAVHEQPAGLATDTVGWNSVGGHHAISIHPELENEAQILGRPPWWKWFLFATRGAISYSHTDGDGLCTSIQPRSGAKAWFVIRGKSRHTAMTFAEAKVFIKDWALDRADFEDSGKDLTCEVMLVRGPMMMCQQPNLPHAVYTVESSVFSGTHFYALSTIRSTFAGLVHCLILVDNITNSIHEEFRTMLCKLVHYVHWAVISNEKGVDRSHCFDVNKMETPEFEMLIGVISCGWLMEVLDPRTYTGSLPASAKRAYIVARGMAKELGEWFCSAYKLSMPGIVRSGKVGATTEDKLGEVLAHEAFGIYYEATIAGRADLANAIKTKIGVLFGTNVRHPVPPASTFKELVKALDNNKIKEDFNLLFDCKTFTLKKLEHVNDVRTDSRWKPWSEDEIIKQGTCRL